MPIRVLPPMVASRIAAGEVIERPASVVKELVENALDAAARHVVVEADGGGVERLCVADDGVGIAAGEVRLAFARHATSKLTALDDLDQLATFGFRGEALPSIAAVAEVGLLTRCADQPDGSLVRVRFGRLVEEQRAARAPGTTVTVADLFGELPARRKFLRAPGSEASQVARVATQLALGQPGVRFEIRVDGRVVLATPGRGDAREVLAAVYGPSIARAMLPLPEPAANGAGLQVRGLVGPPDVHRGTRAGITLFVNGRLVYSRALQYAVEEAFHTLLPVGRRPIALLWLDVPPTDLDVNVHPTKQEVRFLHDRMVFAAVQRAVREVVGDAAGVPVWGGERSPR